jgi:putative inorganic carbon (HCO3(-)) transporter
MPALPSAVRRAAARLDDWHGLILLLAAPVFLFPSPAWTPVLLVLPALWLAAWLAGRPLLPPTPLNVPLLLLSLMVLISLGVTFDIGFSLSHLTGVLLGLAVFIAVVRLVRTPPALRQAVNLYILAGGGLVLLGLVGIDWLDKVPLLTRITDALPAVVRGLPGAEAGFSANSVAGALTLVFPLQVALLAATLADRSRTTVPAPARRWLAAQAVLLLLTGGLLLLAQSRSSWFGIAGGLALLLAWSSRRGRWLAAAAVALVAIALAGSTLASAAQAPLEGGLSDRREIWLRALYVIRDYPLTGLGLNAFRSVMPRLYPMYRTSPDFNFAHAHNLLLQAAVDLGLPGLAAYLAVWWGAGVALVGAHRTAADPWLCMLARGLGAGLAAHFVFGLTDAISLGAKLGIFFWLALALSAAAYQVARARVPAAHV